MHWHWLITLLLLQHLGFALLIGSIRDLTKSSELSPTALWHVNHFVTYHVTYFHLYCSQYVLSQLIACILFYILFILFLWWFLLLFGICSVCSSFVVCSHCFTNRGSRLHDVNHLFLKLNARPLRRVSVTSVMKQTVSWSCTLLPAPFSTAVFLNGRRTFDRRPVPPDTSICPFPSRVDQFW